MTTFRTIMADPPWNERGSGRITRGAQRHYPLLKTREIAPTILRCPLFRPAVHAHLWMWATSNRLPDAIQVIAQLGFRYVTNLVWVKVRNAARDLQIGLGQYARGSHELLLFAVKNFGKFA